MVGQVAELVVAKRSKGMLTDDVKLTFPCRFDSCPDPHFLINQISILI